MALITMNMHTTKKQRNGQSRRQAKAAAQGRKAHTEPHHRAASRAPTTNLAGGRIRLKREEMLGALTVDTAGAVHTESRYLNPGLAESGGWGANMAAGYAAWHARHYRIEFRPTAPTTRSGSVILSVGMPDTPPAYGAAALMQREAAAQSAVYQECEIEFEPSSRRRMVRNIGTVVDGALIQYDAGRLDIRFVADEPGEIGYLYICYDVELLQPSPDISHTADEVRRAEGWAEPDSSDTYATTVYAADMLRCTFPNGEVRNPSTDALEANTYYAKGNIPADEEIIQDQFGKDAVKTTFRQPGLYNMSTSAEQGMSTHGTYDIKYCGYDLLVEDPSNPGVENAVAVPASMYAEKNGVQVGEVTASGADETVVVWKYDMDATTARLAGCDDAMLAELGLHGPDDRVGGILASIGTVCYWVEKAASFAVGVARVLRTVSQGDSYVEGHGLARGQPSVTAIMRSRERYSQVLALGPPLPLWEDHHPEPRQSLVPDRRPRDIIRAEAVADRQDRHRR